METDYYLEVCFETLIVFLILVNLLSLLQYY